LAILSASILAGCAIFTEGEVKKRSLTVRSVKEYFARKQNGYPVAMIEADLCLPEPRELEAPALGWPGWKYRYVVDDIVISFYAERAKGDGDDDKFLYAGNLDVKTVHEHFEAIRLKGSGRGASDAQLRVEPSSK
jgi:hypothetical protein